MKSPGEPPVAVEIDNLHFFRGEREILHDVNLSIHQGSFLGVVGPNGGGKTTLCRLIMGLLKPTEGRVDLFGVPAAIANQSGELVGYVPQRQSAPAGFPARVVDVVLMAVAKRISPFRRIPKDLVEQAYRCLEQVDLTRSAEVPIENVSGGQHQRVLIARAMMGRPRLLVLDEPLEGVDIDGRRRFMDLIHKLIAEENLTVVMVSHDVNHLAEFSDRILCLNKTIHWHDRSELLVPSVLNDLYSCEWNLLLDYSKQASKGTGSSESSDSGLGGDGR